jgi:putative addiction module killer protein
MREIRQTDEFRSWLKGLHDARAKAKIVARIDRLAIGNAGDIAPVGEGVSELRIHHGPGYRVYLVQRGETLCVGLCGGDKSTQQKDIERAKRLARELED